MVLFLLACATWPLRYAYVVYEPLPEEPAVVVLGDPTLKIRIESALLSMGVSVLFPSGDVDKVVTTTKVVDGGNAMTVTTMDDLGQSITPGMVEGADLVFLAQQDGWLRILSSRRVLYSGPVPCCNPALAAHLCPVLLGLKVVPNCSGIAQEIRCFNTDTPEPAIVPWCGDIPTTCRDVDGTVRRQSWLTAGKVAE